MYNAVEPDIKHLQSALVLADDLMVDGKNKMEDALRAQRDESRRVHALSRASYEDQIMNMNVPHQLGNTLGLAEVARLVEQVRSHALMSEGSRSCTTPQGRSSNA
eukprot:9654995-Heterocapsa_arctica.AAC.1